jgi:hypothetical protein
VKYATSLGYSIEKHPSSGHRFLKYVNITSGGPCKMNSGRPLFKIHLSPAVNPLLLKAQPNADANCIWWTMLTRDDS